MEYIGIIWVTLVIIGVMSVSIKNQKRRMEQQKNAVDAGMPAIPQGRPVPQAQPMARPATQISPITGKPRKSLHEAKPLEAHMHVPVMGQEGVGTEGEDCCHDYMLTSKPQEEDLALLPGIDRENEERAKALLQGVVFSEILGRRPIKRYGGYRA